jgi:UDP-glucose 4-epimerase
MNVLIVGGSNHLGAHLYAALHQAGYRPVIVDAFSKSWLHMRSGLRRLLGREPVQEAGDMSDPLWLQGLVRRYKPVCTLYMSPAVQHLSHRLQRMQDLQVRLDRLVSLMGFLDQEKCRTIQFVSSSTVYSTPQTTPLREDSAKLPLYIDSHNKMFEEELLRGVCALRPEWTVSILRQFHVLGTHPSGCLSEPMTPSHPNLMSRIMAAAQVGHTPLRVQSHGGQTPDGSACLDFVHIQDVAQAHVKALDALLTFDESFTVNVGTGRSHSVLELVRAVEHISGNAIDWGFDDLLEDDPPHCVADIELCAELLAWRAQLPMETMCADAWRWHQGLPPGYAASA